MVAMLVTPFQKKEKKVIFLDKGNNPKPSFKMPTNFDVIV
jgi:hypothetical protein